MRVLIGAVAAAMILCGSAAAQSETTPSTPSPTPAVQAPPSRCGAFPEAPSLPDGARASADSMTTALAAFQAWDTAYREVLACRRNEHGELVVITTTRKDEHDAGARNLNTAIQSWEAEVAEFNARENRPRPRGRQ